MKIAILRVADTCQLTVLKTNKDLTKNAIAVSYSLSPSNVLTETQTKLGSMDIDEFWVIMQGSITVEKETEHTVTKAFGTKKNPKISVIHNSDLDKLKYVAKHIGVSKLRVFDLLDVFGKMGAEQPTLFCSDYALGRFAYIYVDGGKVKDHRVWRTADARQVKSMLEEYNTNNVMSIYNDLFDSIFGDLITNWEFLSRTEKQVFSLSLASLNLDAVKEYELDGTMVREVKTGYNPSKEVAIIADRNVKATPKVNLPSLSINIPKFKNMSGELSFNNSLTDLIVNVAGVAVSLILAVSIVANKQLPKDIEYLANKQSELTTLIEPKQDTANYYTRYVSAIENKQPNVDEDYITKIKAVQVDGLLLAGIQIQKDSIGLVVYLKDENQIDTYTQALGKIITVPQVVKKGTVSLDSTTLTKFVINGKR